METGTLKELKGYLQQVLSKELLKGIEDFLDTQDIQILTELKEHTALGAVTIEIDLPVHHLFWTRDRGWHWDQEFEIERNSESKATRDSNLSLLDYINEQCEKRGV